MELSPQFINDMMINFGAYIIAGICGALFYKLVVKRNSKEALVTASDSDNQTSLLPVEAKEELPKQKSKIEFIKLGEKISRLSEQVQNDLPTDRKQIGSRRENRPEIMNIARTMLKAGANFESIKKVLPVSEAELNLIKMNNN